MASRSEVQMEATGRPERRELGEQSGWTQVEVDANLVRFCFSGRLLTDALLPSLLVTFRSEPS